MIFKQSLQNICAKLSNDSFEIGDKIECTDNGQIPGCLLNFGNILEIGKQYIITDKSELSVHISGIYGGGMYANRFKKVQ